jgi:uncharacterized protein (DUF58 family)
MTPAPRAKAVTFLARAGAVGSVDLFPAVSGRVRRAVGTPLGVLVAAAAVAALCGLAVHPRVFALAGGLLAVAAAGVWWPWVTARGVRAAVGFDRERVTEGEPARAMVTVTNHLPWPAVGLAVRGGFDPSDDTGPSLAARLPAVPGRAELSAGWRFVPPARGDYPVAPPRVATGFPFGVREAGRAAAVAARLVVWPRTVPVGPVPDAAGEEVPDGNVTRSKVGATGEVLGARPYRRGDSPRRIHWAQSARHDRLIVCELQSNSRPVVLLVLDADPAVHTPGPDGSREWAVRVTASFAKGWLDEGAEVGAAWDGFVLPPASGRRQAARILDGLARLNGTTRPVGEVLRSPAVRAVRAGVRVVVSTDAATADARDGSRWVVLSRGGFGGPARVTCDDAPPRSARPWLELPAADRVPALLRGGWSEARHGS